jgi:hypothetical protein
MGSAEVALDSSNRMLIPRRLYDLAGIDRDVVLAGQDGRIEIWPEGAYSSARCCLTILPTWLRNYWAGALIKLNSDDVSCTCLAQTEC